MKGAVGLTVQEVVAEVVVVAIVISRTAVQPAPSLELDSPQLFVPSGRVAAASKLGRSDLPKQSSVKFGSAPPEACMHSRAFKVRM